MKTQHTPGPWIFDADNYNLTNQRGDIVFGEDGSQDMRLISPSKENARLIAAAPDLLDALVACECELSQNHGLAWSNRNAFLDAVNTARAAIKKARGES